ncbi:AAA family ATPase [Microbulbifer elongatus]|uniref:AAA family ATPase n=1 Tax=Microbulbifer elongatus TaxID=86173 RepID=A0ABT1P583_9GAMM|nr:AAA family ATPase [Microbulbifer elongatus]MCQ3830189.1 AAA family ATPase [Microbulbifer elongatus]
MPLEKIEISGFRGFCKKQSLEFSIPNDEPGSGLTVITGANNSGKSSIIECLKARGGYQSPSFTVGARNSAIDFVEIKYFIDGREESVSSLKKGSSETKKDEVDQNFHVFVLPSRRAFNPFFNRGSHSREQYLQNTELSAQRSSMMDNFQYRLFNILENQDAFNEILHKVLTFKPEWSIDQSDQGQYFLKFYNGEFSHTSDGMGEGVVSIFAIVDSLYDSKPGDVIVIDEPELSLHPALQKRVFELLKDFSKDRQIIISTHSPYFVDVTSIVNGSNLVRVVNSGSGTEIFQLSSDASGVLDKLSRGNLYNPHIFGLDARELFFQEDGIVVVEGQEDVLLFPDIASQLNTTIAASFFGWGAGGASNIGYICFFLKDLGFKKVAAILDGDKAEEMPELEKNYPDFHFVHICADDIRTKKARKAIDAVDGLLDEKRIIKSEHKEHTLQLLDGLNKYMGSP